MNNQELSVRLTERLAELSGADPAQLREAIDTILYDYDVSPREKALVPMNNTQDHIRLYLATRRLDGLSEATLYGYRGLLNKLDVYLRKNVQDITIMDLRRFLAEYASRAAIKKSTLATKIWQIKSFFSWLQDQEYIIKNPAKQIRATKQDSRLRKALASEELEKMRDSCKSLRDLALVDFFCSSGCRVSEVVGVDVGDINWSELSLHVIGKGNKERIVYFNPRTKLHLQKYLMSRGNPSGDQALFVSEREPHGRLGREGLLKIIRGIGIGAGINRPVYPHLLRHSMATQALKAGAPLTTIQTWLGHSDPKTTQTYAEVDPDMVRHEYKRAFL